MPVATCPPSADLQRLFLGGMSDVDVLAVEQHVLACSQCRGSLETLLREKDTLSQRLSGDTKNDAFTSSPALSELVKKIKSLRGSNGASGKTENVSQNGATITIACPSCKKKLAVKEGLAGKKVKCPACGQVTTVPAPRVEAAVNAGNLRTVLPAPIADAPTIAPSAASQALTHPPATQPDATLDVQARPGEVDASLIDFLAPPQSADELGRLGNYRILKLLGHGGMGVVYLGEDVALHRKVAIKAMLPHLAGSKSSKERFLREAQTAAKLQHDHIVAIHHIAEDRGAPYIVMPLLKGEPLDERLKREQQLPLAEVVRIGREMAKGLAAAHAEGLIHRDIKPANVWLEAPESRVKILDFGLARATSEESDLTQQGAVIGTPAYMSPEQARGATADARTDLFSLGVVLYRLATGKQPFYGNDTVSTLVAVATHTPPSPDELNADVPAQLSRLVMGLLEKDPDKRVGTAAEVLQVLSDLSKNPATAIATPRPAKNAKGNEDADTITLAGATTAKKPPHRSKGVFVLVGVAVLAMLFCGLVVGGVVVYRFFFENRDGRLEVVVEGEDAKIHFQKGKLVIFDKDGKTKLYTLSPSERNRKLPLGEYMVRVEGADGLEVRTPLFNMTRDGYTIRVRALPNSPLKKEPDPKQKTPDPTPANIELVRKIPVAAVRDLFYETDVSPGGKYALVTRDIAPGVQCDVYNVATGERVFECPGYRAAFLGDAEVVAQEGSYFRVFDTRSGKKLREGTHAEFFGFRVAPGNKHLVYWGPKAYGLFDLTAMKELRSWPYKNPGPRNYVEDFAFTSDGKRLVIRPGAKEPWIVWNIDKNQATDEAKYLAGVKAIFWQFPGDNTFAVDRNDKMPRLDITTGKVVEELTGADAMPGAVEGTYARDGRSFVIRFADGRVSQFALPFGRPEVARYQLPADDYAVPLREQRAQSISADSGFATMLTAKNLYVLRLAPLPAPRRLPVVPETIEKGVLDYAEVHDVDEKTFDAWLPKLQKDGLRPVSFSIQIVNDAPRYTAVALEEQKRQLWDFSRETFGEEAGPIDRMHTKNYGAYVQNPFTFKDTHRVAVFWQWNSPRTWLWTGDKVFINNKTIEAKNDAEYVPVYRCACDQGRGLVYSVLYGPDDRIPTKDLIDQSLDECKEQVVKGKAERWQPTNLYAYGSGAKLLFGLTQRQLKDGPDWDVSWSLTPAAYETELKDRKAQSFRPHSPIYHDDGTGARVSVIWIRYRSARSATVAPAPAQVAEHAVTDFAEIHNADDKTFDAWIAKMRTDGFRPTRLTVQSGPETPRYTAIALKDDKKWPWEFSRCDSDDKGHNDKFWKRKFEAIAHGIYRYKNKTYEAFIWARDDSLDNALIWFGDDGSIEKKLQAARKKKQRLSSRNAVFDGSDVEFAIVIDEPDGVPWQDSANLALDGVKAWIEKQKADGWRPDHLYYYGVGNKRLFGAILIKDASKADWDVSWSLTAAEYEKEVAARKTDGFRPLTAIGHEDAAGGQKFSAIWIRYRIPGAAAAAPVTGKAPDLSAAKVLLDDRFTDPQSGFFKDLKESYGEARYLNGKYHAKATPGSYVSCANGKYSDFACELTGRLINPASGQWGLNIFAPTIRNGIAVTINWDGKLNVRPENADESGSAAPRIGPIAHDAIKKGGEPNTLLVIVRGRQVEVYVNSVAVCAPITVDRDITPAWASIAVFGGKSGAQGEFTRYTIRSAENLPSATTSAAAPEKKRPVPPAFINKLGMEFALIPKGKAWLGGGNGKEGNQPVAFDDDFYLGCFELTQTEWEKVMGIKHPFHFSRKGEGTDQLLNVSDEDLKRFPVENVSWNECQLFLKKLNELTKETGWEYRLPTEAEWEYACRGGPGDRFQSAFDFYLEEPTNVLLTSQANFEHDAGLKRTRKVGAHAPNKLGLYDMHGNVSELTHDPQPEKDDDGKPKRNERGGGWTNTGDECKATGRFAWSPSDRFRDVGLRVARVRVKK